MALLGLVVSACAPPPPVCPPGATLRAEAERLGILIGSGGIAPDHLDDPAYGEVLAAQFNSLSPENELKWSEVEPARGQFDFAGLDRLVAFAEEHDMAVKGHGLISGGFNPDWLTEIRDPDELRAVLFEHFNTIMDRYAGSMDRWDVATEVFSYFGGSGLSDNYFHQVLGSDYLAEVFQIAHEADPDAKLFLNESLVEYYPAKRSELFALVSDLVSRGVPIHGVGLETHMTLYPPEPGAIAGIVRAYEQLGIEVAITELDVHVVDADDYQAHMYGTVVAEALAAGVTDISFWGFTDRYTWTWLPGAEPHMFDADLQPKPAFCSTWTALSNRAALDPI